MSDRILIVGSGGREHALGWKLANEGHEIYTAPGNAGTAEIGTNVPLPAEDVTGLRSFADEQGIDLTVVGPDKPLALGIVDAFKIQKLPIFGPRREVARLETSKVHAINFMAHYEIPYPETRIYASPRAAKEYLMGIDPAQWVIKADGLAEGKGVVLPKNVDEATQTIDAFMVNKIFGKAGEKVLIQERLEGKELSVFVLTNGEDSLTLPLCRDYKPVDDGNEGPNTGGMGAFTPVSDVEPELLKRIEQKIIEPTIKGLHSSGAMHSEKLRFSGVLYFGLMLTAEGPKVIEYNVRFGDPECQVLMLQLDEELLPLLHQAAGNNGGLSSIKIKNGSAVTVALTAKGYPSPEYERGQEIFGLDKTYKGVEVFHAGTKREKNRLVTAGGRILHIAARGKNLEQARQRVYGSIGENAIHFSGMYHRTDIASANSLLTAI